MEVNLSLWGYNDPDELGGGLWDGEREKRGNGMREREREGADVRRHKEGEEVE